MKTEKKEELHLSVRKMRELKRAMKERELADARIHSLETIGTMNIKELMEHGAKLIADAIVEAVPQEFLRRKTVAMAIKMAIPKSPRGRKPHSKAA